MAMKKTFKTIGLILLAAVMALGVAACNGIPSWNVSMVADGEVSSNGGFLVEKGDYVYFINGVADYTEQNDFGTPVTGSLVVAKKNDLATTEIVVPKLMTAGDYTAGIAIYGDYVYYATPSTEKDTSGAIATGYLEFYKTKLDGSETVRFTRVNGNSTVYRFVETGGKVYLVYTNANDKNEDGDTVTSLMCYDTEAMKETTVAQGVASVSYTALSQAATLTALYTKTVKNEITGSNETYNELYAYTAGAEEPVMVASGKNWTGEEGSTSDVTYAVTATNGNYVFYTVTRAADSDVKTYSIEASEIAKGSLDQAVRLEDTTAATASAIIVSLNEAYASVSLNSKTFLAKYDMLSQEPTKYEIVVQADISTLLLIEDGYAYYVNSSSYPARVALNGSANEEEVLSNDTVSTSWYKPEVADGKIFYINTTDIGQSYVHYLSMTPVADADPADVKGTFVGLRSDEDKVALVEIYLNKIPTASVRFSQDEDGNWLTDENGNRYNEEVAAARREYDALDASLQKKVSESAYEILTNAEAVLKATEVFMKLTEEPYKDITAETLSVHEALVADAEAALEALTEAQQTMLKSNRDDNLMWRLQEAKERIEELKE